MKSNAKKSRKLLGKSVNQIIKKYELYDSLTSLYSNTENKIKNLSFPSQVKRIADGFYQFQCSSKVGLFPKNNVEVGEFYRFLYILNHILDNCKNKEDKDHLINQLKIKCKEQNVLDNLRGFYYELKILSKLLNDGFIIEKLPEAFSKNYDKGFSIPDGLVSKNGKLLQVECKTVSHNIGHPIIEEAGLEFLDILTEDEIYNDICPKDYYCHIQFTFDKPLVNSQPKEGNKDCLLPSTLLNKFKLDYNNKSNNLRVNISRCKSLTQVIDGIIYRNIIRLSSTK